MSNFHGQIAKVLFAIVLSASILSQATENPGKPPRFDIQVNPDFGRYLDLLERPPYLLLALESSGAEINISGRLLILDDHAAQLRNITLTNVNVAPTLRFSHKKDDVFFYNASMMDLQIPVNIDASSLGKGTISIIFPSVSNNIILSKFSGVIERKIRMLTNEKWQRQMLRYLDDMAKKKPAGRTQIEWIASQIILDGYNKRTPGNTNGSGGYFWAMSKNNNESESAWWPLLTGLSLVVLMAFALRRWSGVK